MRLHIHRWKFDRRHPAESAHWHNVHERWGARVVQKCSRCAANRLSWMDLPYDVQPKES